MNSKTVILQTANQMKKRNQKKIADYLAFLDQVFEPEKKIKAAPSKKKQNPKKLK